MSTDIRIKVGFFDNKKTNRLRSALGLSGIESLIRLWMYAAENNQDGDLSNMDMVDIEFAAKWTGEPGAFLSTVTHDKCRFIDGEDGSYCLHEWEEHNGFVFNQKNRSEIARSAAKASWDRRKQSTQHTNSNAPSMTDVQSEYDSSNAPSPSPSPSPLPTPTPMPFPSPALRSAPAREAKAKSTRGQMNFKAAVQEAARGCGVSLPDAPSPEFPIPVSVGQVEPVEQVEQSGPVEQPVKQSGMVMPVQPDAFEYFYAVYPRSENLPLTVSVWNGLGLDREGYEDIARYTYTRKLNGELTANDPKFIKTSATYLRDRGWEDNRENTKHYVSDFSYLAEAINNRHAKEYAEICRNLAKSQ
jgi:hypothetical protein